MAATFASTYAEFLDDLKSTFPEYAAALTHAGTLPHAEARFIEVWGERAAAIAAQDESIFGGAGAGGVELVPGFVMTRALWNELSPATHAALWKYLSTLLLLSASQTTDGKGLWDLSGFQTSMSALMDRLKAMGEKGDDGGSGFAALFEQLNKMAGSFGVADLSGAASNFKIPEKLFRGHIARIVEELVKEFSPEDFGITPAMMEEKDPRKMFEFLQEIFTKKPDMLMSVGQKIAKKLQAKFASGGIRREDIINEVEELMKEFSNNTAFTELFGNLGEMLKSSERASGNEGSARLREARERLRRRTTEREARRAGAATANVVVTAEQAAAAEAMAAVLLAEESAAAPAKRGGAAKKR
jgi:hypothetical protein